MSNLDSSHVIIENKNLNDNVNMETIVNGNQDKDMENDVEMLDIQFQTDVSHIIEISSANESVKESTPVIKNGDI